MKSNNGDIKSPEAAVLVTGGTGLLGKVVCRLLDRNHTPYIIGTHRSVRLNDRYTHIDLKSEEGMPKAIAGKKIIFHLASDKKHPKNDVAGTMNMLNEIKRQGQKPHFIYISIVGSDRLPMTYFREKSETEEVIKNSGVAFSILRATQFHEYLSDVIGLFLKIPFVAFVPKKMPVQPIDVSVVAEQLIQISLHTPTSGIENLGGKDTFTFGQSVLGWLHSQNRHKMLLNLPLWGRLGRNLNNGALTTPFSSVRGKNWRQWLNENYA